MKASEAIKILEALDPSHEVTLTIGRKAATVPHPYTPNWQTVQPIWIKGTEWPGLGYRDITCKTVH